MSIDRPSEVTDRFWLTAHVPDGGLIRGAGGKWLVFVPVDHVDDWWWRIKAATENGRLGPLAKVATAKPNRNARSSRERVICVYTADWRDRDDVQRVLKALRRMGVDWRLAYKTDAATGAGRYGDGAAVYVSQADRSDFEERHSGSDRGVFHDGPELLRRPESET